jgi:diaminohydroxyphosphoribosylaminopyrimidine deaminase/5-amino-6-(5-phosphoribosylamino)uracil reductase
MVRKTPWVRMKIAASLDGQTALTNGTSQWITGDAARADGHAWRARAGAVLTGHRHVLEDDPRLDVRLSRPAPAEAGDRRQPTADATRRPAVRHSRPPIWIYAARREEALAAALEAAARR